MNNQNLINITTELIKDLSHIKGFKYNDKAGIAIADAIIKAYNAGRNEVINQMSLMLK